MADSKINGVAAGAIGAGALLVYAGVKGYSVGTTVRSLITGASPQHQPQATPIGTPVAAPSSGTSATGSAGQSAIAANALQVIGHAYRFGGAPGPDGTGPWDCSSCADWVVGRMSGLPIPGGSWSQATHDGAEHGPNTISWLTWSGAQTVGHHSSAAQPGDLAVWQTHMGIVTGPDEMVSAQNPAAGTRKSKIDGFIPEFLFIRRIVIGNPHA